MKGIVVGVLRVLARGHVCFPLAALACGGSGASPAAPDAAVDTVDAGGSTVDATSPSGDAAEAGPGATPIRYVLVVVKENHTFDNYFTGFPGADTAATATLSTGQTVLRPTAPDGSLPQDICHSNACGQTAYADGGMSGFDRIGAADLPFVRYTEAQIPNYWQYARSFVLVDHLFSTTMGPSTPGHATFWAAQSLVLDNASCPKDAGACGGFGCAAAPDVTITAFDPDTCTTAAVYPCFDVPVIVDHLPSGFTWRDYGGQLGLMFQSVASAPDYAPHFRSQASLVADLAAGDVANLTIAHLWEGPQSEHPAGDPCPGENFTVDIVNAAMQSPYWDQMAIVITWDDWGGFYDHVPPPVRRCANGQIFQSGFRLPAIILSPYARQRLVLSTPAEQASVPRLVEDLWGMPYMSARDPHARDGVAGSLMGAFDFTQPPRPPLLLATRTCP